MVRRAQLRTERERGLTPEEQAAANLARLTLAATEAFGAATLVEAQEAIGAVIPGLVTSITASAAWSNPTGAAPQSTTSPPLTVPAGNPGRLLIVPAGDLGNLFYDLAGGGDVALTTTIELDVADTNSLDFTLDGTAGDVAVISVYDRTTGAQVRSNITITLT
jgi:hypothetical protein